MSEAATRCQARSLSLNESLHGTASTVHGWVLLEEPGPWGADALRDCRIGESLTTRLNEMCRKLRLRVLLIRRAERRSPAPPGVRNCFLARTGPGEGWVQQAWLDDPEQVLDLDLSALARGESPGLRPVAEPLYLVCTQGRHDPCCAELGRPVVRALAAKLPDRTWEVSHIGGDRFAGNLVVLPHGLYYGRVPPDEVVALAQAYERGEVDPRYLRGRTAYGFAVQAAECLLRSRTDIRGVDELPLVSSHRDGDDTEAVFTAPEGGRYRVRVSTRSAPPERVLTCHAERPAVPVEHHLVEIHHDV
ncbi:hypothetical protein FHX42_002290 [Saccharopolyspora lacisalsi]|uniref:Sucrase ferredoxin n=1 Tax=Halosaccharopolyspora lacisalsi TaxID=1000566 RepID=A0A839DV72_9PSEU|nr:sucrase ferredoxin [Halosaccharopolyspora lacisalsi]MBA8824943.1 hypothetical protein [Halosaccharopolyspora lacisalsi]